MSVSTITFDKINIDESIVKGLNDVGYSEPTPLQTSVIPVALEKNDLIVKARSGMGKNGSFIIPVLQRLVDSTSKPGTRALILTPEVESARKIDEMIWAIGYHGQIESSVIDMKGDWEEQTQAVKDEPPVIVANPGRLASIMSENRLVFKNLEVLVIDEADKIEKIGIISQVNKILERVSGDPQTLFYSSTFTDKVKKLAKHPVKGEAIYIGFDVFKDVEELDDVESIGLDRDKSDNGRKDKQSDSTGKAEAEQQSKQSEKQEEKKPQNKEKQKKISKEKLGQLKQGYMHVPGRMKISTLMGQLERSPSDSTIIFTASKRGTDRLYKILRKNNKNVTSIFGKLSNRKRDERLEGFREGNYNYLLVADIPAGKLGVENVQQVINYDVPNEVDAYVERVGLIQDGGQIVSLVSKQDRDDIDAIKKQLDPTPDEWDLPKEVKKNKDKKSGSGKKKGRSDERKKKSRSKRSGKKRGKKKRREHDELQLPQPNYDKLSGGRQGREDKEEEESSGIIGFVKKLFS